MRFHLGLALAILAAVVPVRAQEDLAIGDVPADAEGRAVAKGEASDTGEGSFCLGYDPNLTIEQLLAALAKTAKINAKIVSAEGEAGIATVYFAEAEPHGLVVLDVAPEDQAEYGLHRCAVGGAGAGVLPQAGLLAVFAGGGLIGVLLGDDDDDGGTGGPGVIGASPTPSAGPPGSPSGQPDRSPTRRPREPQDPTRTPGRPPGQPTPPPGATTTPADTATPAATSTPGATLTPGASPTAGASPTQAVTPTPVATATSPPPPTSTPRPPSPMR